MHDGSRRPLRTSGTQPAQDSDDGHVASHDDGAQKDAHGKHEVGVGHVPLVDGESVAGAAHFGSIAVVVVGAHAQERKAYHYYDQEPKREDGIANPGIGHVLRVGRQKDFNESVFASE